VEQRQAGQELGVTAGVRVMCLRAWGGQQTGQKLDLGMRQGCSAPATADVCMQARVSAQQGGEGL